MKKAFTLIELLIVITFIGILSTTAMAIFSGGTDKARRATLATDISAMHKSIEFFRADKGYKPGSIDALVESGFLDIRPTNPFYDSEEVQGKYGYAVGEEDTAVAGNFAAVGEKSDSVNEPEIFIHRGSRSYHFAGKDIETDGWYTTDPEITLSVTEIW